MPSATQEQVQAINQKLATDPVYQQLVQRLQALNARFNAGERGPQLFKESMDASTAIDQYREAHGLSAHDWHTNINSSDPANQQGLYTGKDSFFERNPWAAALLYGGTAVAAPYLFAATAPAAASGGSAGTAGTAGTAGGGAAAGESILPGGEFAGTSAAEMVPGAELGIPYSAAGPSGVGGTGILSALQKWGPVIGGVGNAISQGAAADAAGRRYDAANNARAIAENNAAKVQAAQFNLGLPTVRTNQVARGEVLNTMRDAPLTGDPRIDKFAGGGLIPSAFGPQSRAAGAELSRQAMSGLMNPSQDRVTPQEIPMSSPSTLDNVLGGVGTGLSIFSLLQKYGQNPNGTPPYFPPGTQSPYSY